MRSINATIQSVKSALDIFLTHYSRILTTDFAIGFETDLVIQKSFVEVNQRNDITSTAKLI